MTILAPLAVGTVALLLCNWLMVRSHNRFWKEQERRHREFWEAERRNTEEWLDRMLKRIRGGA